MEIIDGTNTSFAVYSRGDIKIGDRLTSKNGFVVKAQKGDPIAGTAMESANGAPRGCLVLDDMRHVEP